MKIKHRPYVAAPREGGDLVDSDYELEVQAAVARLEKAYAKAEQRLAKAIAKAQRAESQERGKKAAQGTAADLWAVVELRRMELDNILRLLAASPQSSAHRGRASFRPVPVNMGLRP